MKSYKEIAENVFERRDEYLKEQSIKKQRIKKLTVSVSAVFAVILTGFGVWKSGMFNSAVSLNSTESGSQKTSEAIYGNSVITENSTVKKPDENHSDKNTEKQYAEKDESADCSKKSKEKKNNFENKKAEQNTSDVIWNSDDEESYGMPCVHSPEIGSYVLDYPVQVMLNKYGSSKKYAVSISMVKEGFSTVTDQEKNAEYKRLKDAGCDVKKYTVPYYTGAEAKKEYCVVIGIICTKEQLETLFTGREYGYYIQFFATDDSSKQPNVANPDDFFEKTTSDGYFMAYN